MQDAHEFLRTLAVVLCAAAVTTVLFHRLKQPVVFGYLLAGMIVSPNVPVPLVADEATVRTLAEMGVILLLFALGLELSLRKFLRIGRAASAVAIAETSAMMLVGYTLGQLFGWTTLESLFTGAVVAISSTTIIAKAFAEQRVTGKFTEVVLGVLIVEDLIAIFLIAVLTTLSLGADVSATSLATTGLRLMLFLVGLVGVGLWLVPRSVRAVVRMNRPETTLIASMGICFAAALLALTFGYSVALGAFIAGSLVAESGHDRVIAQLVQPVRDVFAAIFFVSVGMLIDPGLVAEHWVPVIVLTAAVVTGKVIAVSTGAFLVGYTPRTAVQTGMSLAQIGEFSFIIVGVGLATGSTRPFLYPIAVAVSAITTLTTPWFIRSSGGAAATVDRRLPRPLQTFIALYGSWIERLRMARPEKVRRSRTRRLAGLIILDTVVIVGVAIGTSIALTGIASAVSRLTGLTESIARVIVVASAVALLVPIAIGLVRTARQLGLTIALRALPTPETGVDLAAAPRRAMLVTLQLVIVAAVVVVMVIAMQPFVPVFRSAIVLTVVFGAVFAALAVAFWRTATDLHGHARAGAEIIVAALAQQMAGSPHTESSNPVTAVQRVRDLLPGMGDPVPLRVPPESAVVDRSLAEVNLRSVTGATVLAILRDRGEQVLMPSGPQLLRAGDLLAVIGSHDAVENARVLLSTARSDARLSYEQSAPTAVNAPPPRSSPKTL